MQTACGALLSCGFDREMSRRWQNTWTATARSFGPEAVSLYREGTVAWLPASLKEGTDEKSTNCPAAAMNYWRTN